jgi:GNAT superfamily N-acetyltransferase
VAAVTPVDTPLIIAGMRARARSDLDLEACEQLLRAVHENDGYPRRLPGDLRGFIVWPGAICAWVAETDGAVVGHVALHTAGSREVMDLAATALGTATERLAVVARLLVSPSVRRQGVGRSLLEKAADHAAEIARTPILEVTTNERGAIRLYETSGWIRIGSTTVRWRSTGEVLDEYVYVAPGLRGAAT